MFQLLVLSVGLCTATSALAQSWTLSYSVQQSVDEHANFERVTSGDEEPVPSGSFTVEARLASEYMSVTGQRNETRAYDFERQTLATIAGKRYSEAPLHWRPHYREQEYLNRIGLSSMLDTGGFEGAFGSQFELESLFCIAPKDDDSPVVITRKNFGNTTTWLCDGTTVVEVTWSTHAIPKDLTGLYDKFLLYEFALHPSIRKAMTAQGNVFASLKYYKAEVGQRFNLEYTLKSVTTDGPDVVKRKKSHKPATVDGDVLGTLINKVQHHAQKGKIALTDSAAAVKQANKLLANNAYLDALLVTFVPMLETGNENIGQIKAILDAGGDHPWVQAFGFALSQPYNEEGAALALEALKSIPQDSIDYAHLLHIFMGNYASYSHEDDPRVHYLMVLEESPQITGVYYDLGNDYRDTFNFESAWKCYNIVLKLEFDHPVARHIEELQVDIELRFPEYFW